MSTALIGALRVVLGLDSAAFEQGMTLAEKKLNAFGKRMGKLGDNLQGLGRNLTTFVTAPIAALGALTIKTAGDFEAAMNRVGAATGATGMELSALENLARDLGRNTSKSASEAADMLEMLAKNGLDAGQILDGAASASIRLSEATGGDLSRSADVATNVMAQFGKQAKDLGPIVDQITAVTLASQFGFDDYALALGQAGGVAGAIGVSLTDFNAVIAATSDTFNSGSDAGTSFKQFLVSLVPQSKKAAVAMQELGLEFFNADGTMKSMAGIAEELKTKMGGLSEEELNTNMKEIFGVDAMRTAIALMREGGAGIDEMTGKINQGGVAQEQAAARMKGFNGEMEKLSGALDDLKISIGKSGLLAALTGFVAGLADLVQQLSQSNPELLKWGVIAAGLAAAIGPVVLGLGMMASGIGVLMPLLPAFGAALAAMTGPLGLIALGIGGVYLAFKNWDYLKEQFPILTSVIEAFGRGAIAIVTGLKEHFALTFQGIKQVLTGDFAGAWETVNASFANIGETLYNIADSVFPGAIAKIVETIKQMAADILATLRGLPAEMLKIGQEIIAGLWNGISAKWEEVKANVVNLGNSISSTIKSTLGIQSPSRVMHEVGVNTMQGLVNGMASMSEQVKGVATDTANAVATVRPQLGDAWAGLREVTNEAENSRNSLSGMFSSLGSSLAGLIKGTSDWRDVLGDVIQNLARIALSNMGSMGGIGGFFQSLIGGLIGFADGGSIMPGGTGGIDSQIVAFRKSPNERVDITKPGQQVGGGWTHITFGLASDGALNIMPEVRGVAQGEAASAAGKVAKAVPSMVDSRTDERQLRRIRPAGAF